MKLQLKKAKKQHEIEQNDIFKRAKADMVKSYKTTIMFLEANGK